MRFLHNTLKMTVDATIECAMSEIAITERTALEGRGRSLSHIWTFSSSYGLTWMSDDNSRSPRAVTVFTSSGSVTVRNS